MACQSLRMLTNTFAKEVQATLPYFWNDSPQYHKYFRTVLLSVLPQVYYTLILSITQHSLTHKWDKIMIIIYGWLLQSNFNFISYQYAWNISTRSIKCSHLLLVKNILATRGSKSWQMFVHWEAWLFQGQGPAVLHVTTSKSTETNTFISSLFQKLHKP